MTFYHRDTCRLCDSRDLLKILSLTPTPPANAFVSREELSVKQQCYPLDLWFCRNCSHVQLIDIVDPGILFSNYVYVSGTSAVFVRHFENYATAIINYATLEKDRLVVDIGSNDGTLLRHFKNHGCRVLGVDPAVNIAGQATQSGIETIPVFFDKTTAEEIRINHGQADVVTANNVFAHIDNLAEIVACINLLLKTDGIFVFEVSYLVDLYEGKLFDMIYHEHLDYHSLQPLVKYFMRYDMEIVQAERVNSHGGSLRCYVQKAGGGRKVNASVKELLQLEKDHGLADENTFIPFANEIQKLGHDLKALLTELRASGKVIAGFGAPAKTTTLMYHYGIDANALSFIVDDNPIKQGLYTPGLHIPVLPVSAIIERKPDYLLILAWNFADAIISNNEQFLNNGGHFIIPLPEIRVI